MTRRLALTLAALLLGTAAASAARKPVPRPARKTPPSRAGASAAAAAVSSEPADTLDAPALFALGASFAQDGESNMITSVRPGSLADQAGLRPGDRLMSAGGHALSSPADAAAALRAWTPGVRLSLIARRGVEIAALETAPVPPGPAFSRDAKDLSPHERVIAEGRAAREALEDRATVKSARSLSVSVRADQSVWIRFPKDLPAGLEPGDEASAETAAALTTDGSLDFLAVPPGSRLRARVLEASDDGEVRAVRLGFYALDLKGGGSYAALGGAAAVSGAPSPARVSSGGTLLAAAPLSTSKNRPGAVLSADSRLRVRLLEPLVLEEPPSYWRAGPGLWIKTIEGGSGARLYEITHVVPGRSAENAGLKAGDRLDSIDGRATDKLDFSDALDRLYGAPGSEFELSVLRGPKSETFKLKRGLRWADGKSAPLPLPFE